MSLEARHHFCSLWERRDHAEYLYRSTISTSTSLSRSSLIESVKYANAKVLNAARAVIKKAAMT